MGLLFSLIAITLTICFVSKILLFTFPMQRQLFNEFAAESHKSNNYYVCKLKVDYFLQLSKAQWALVKVLAPTSFSVLELLEFLEFLEF